MSRVPNRDRADKYSQCKEAHLHFRSLASCDSFVYKMKFVVGARPHDGAGREHSACRHWFGWAAQPERRLTSRTQDEVLDGAHEAIR
jgi:hypothetical protein